MATRTSNSADINTKHGNGNGDNAISLSLMTTTVMGMLMLVGSIEAGEMHITLGEALRLAHTQGRQTITWHEDLHEEEQAYARAVRGYAPIPAASASTGINGSGDPAHQRQNESATLSASQLVPGNGSVTVAGTANRLDGTDSQESVTLGTATVSVRQPLLRGAGLEVWRETRTRAKRSLADRRRSYQLFRYELTTSIAASFWGLQRNQAAVAQARSSAERAQFTRDQSLALMTINKSNANEVFRAETSLFQAQQAVVDAEAALAASTDNLKLQLSIDPATPVVIDTSPPQLVRVTIDSAAAMALALGHRLELAAAKDQIEDAARFVRLALRETLPALDFDGEAKWEKGENGAFSIDPVWSAKLTLTLPLDGRNEDAALEQARLAHVRALRNQAELRERIIGEVREAIRSLRTAETTLYIQDRNRIQAKRRAEMAALDLKAGTLSNRDLVEAQTEVRDAEDAWFAALIAYCIAELGLRRVTGCLVVDDQGQWDSTLPAYATLAEKP